MKEWIEYNFGWQDWKKFRRRIFLIIVTPIVFFLLVKGFWSFQLWYYSSSTQGRIVMVDPIEGISQTRYGSRSSIMGYNIRYVYHVRGIRYEKESIKIGSWNEPIGTYVRIMYNPDNPGRSMIILR